MPSFMPPKTAPAGWGEYGLGPKPLFDTTTLRLALAAGGYIPAASSNAFRAIKHYIHPFAAAWEVKLAKETLWLDAKSAELLPVADEPQWRAAAAADPYTPESAAPDKPGELLLFGDDETFDPYGRLSWLLGDKPFAPQPERLIARVKAKERLVYVTEPLGDKMLYAQSAVGYQRWQSGRLDLALDMNGPRFIPLDALVNVNQGLFLSLIRSQRKEEPAAPAVVKTGLLAPLLFCGRSTRCGCRAAATGRTSGLARAPAFSCAARGVRPRAGSDRRPNVLRHTSNSPSYRSLGLPPSRWLMRSVCPPACAFILPPR
ncbi:hypothetical protein [Cohnella rhizosphaerae]